jgi:hypothetical protein
MDTGTMAVPIAGVRFGHSTSRRRGGRRPQPRKDLAQTGHALRRAPEIVGNIRSVGEESAIIRIFRFGIDGRQPMLWRKGDDLAAMLPEQLVGYDEARFGPRGPLRAA